MLAKLVHKKHQRQFNLVNGLSENEHTCKCGASRVSAWVAATLAFVVAKGSGREPSKPWSACGAGLRSHDTSGVLRELQNRWASSRKAKLARGCSWLSVMRLLATLRRRRSAAAPCPPFVLGPCIQVTSRMFEMHQEQMP